MRVRVSWGGVQVGGRVDVVWGEDTGAARRSMQQGQTWFDLTRHNAMRCDEEMKWHGGCSGPNPWDPGSRTLSYHLIPSPQRRECRTLHSDPGSRSSRQTTISASSIAPNEARHAGDAHSSSRAAAHSSRGSAVSKPTAGAGGGGCAVWSARSAASV